MSTANLHTEDHILEYAGAFRLVRKIAQGGMATVYEAEHLGPAGFAKRVALKVIHPHYAKEKTWLQLFIDEAKLSANLVHGNIVQIYQLGEVDGQYYMAMEYIKGPTVRAIIERHCVLETPVPLPISAYLASRVCRALDFAHNFVSPEGDRLDIVHRDVSPNNIMATWDGHVKLTDFGIAKANTSIDPMQKSPQMLMGKKHYMSPEQLLALEVSGRSDVFAVGVTLYELLALEPLFYEDATELLIDEVTWRPLPSVRELVPDIPRPIEEILTASLDRDPLETSDRCRNGTRARPLVRIAGGRRDAGPAPGTPRRDLHRELPAADGERRAHALLQLQARPAARGRPAPQLVVEVAQAGVMFDWGYILIP